MKVLMTTDTVGGVWTYAVDLCAALTDAGCEVTLITMGAAMSPDQRDAVGKIAGVDVIETTYKLEWMDDPWEDVDQAGELLIDTALHVRPDVVHLNNFAHGALPWDVLGVRVVVVGHSCVETWWRAVKRESAGPAWQRYREVVRRGIHGADVFVAPTDGVLRAFSACYGKHRAARVIHNGRAPSGYVPRAKQPRILAAGRFWDEAKNIASLERASAWLDWPVRVAGAVCEPGHGEGAAPAVGCGGPSEDADAGIQFVGRLTPARLAKEMGRAAIYALPARYEPFGLSAVEAALSGCALVLGDIDTLHEVWGEAALFVDPDSPRAIAEGINALIADRPRRKRLAAAAHHRAGRYTATRMTSRYLTMYRNLAGRPRYERARSQGVTV